MKTKFITLMVVLAVSMSSLNVFAQNNQVKPIQQKRTEKRITPEQMMERHIKMMESRLVLDDATAAKFNPLYKEYLQALKECRPATCKKAAKTEMTDADIEKCIQERFEAQKKALDIQQKYFQKFKKILNAKQLRMVFCKEEMHKHPGMKDGHMMRKDFPQHKGMKFGGKNCPECPVTKK